MKIIGIFIFLGKVINVVQSYSSWFESRVRSPYILSQSKVNKKI